MLEKHKSEEILLPVKALTFSQENPLKNEKKTDEEENEKLLLKEREDTDEKTHLQKIFKRLGTDLEKSKKRKLEKFYMKYKASEKSSDKEIKTDTGKALLCFMFQILLPVMEIINLIGIFSIISVMNCSFTLFINSVKSYLGFGGEYHLNFYKEFYERSMSEPIDFNVMFFMNFIGNILLSSSGFIGSSIIFLVLNFVSFFMINSFEFKNNIENKEGEENQEIELYNFFNLVYILLFYLILFIGVGGSSMLSQQILVDSHEKLKQYNKKLEKLKKKEQQILQKKISEEEIYIRKLKSKYIDDDDDTDEDKKIESDDESEGGSEEEINANIIKNSKDNDIKENDVNKDKDKEKDNINNNIEEIKEEKMDNDNENNNLIQIDENNLEIIDEVGNKENKEEKDKKEKKKKKDKIERRTEGKFDYFFMICITTIIGYFGKYYFSSILGYQLFNSKDEHNYRKFYYYIMIIYATCILVSLLIYGLFSFIFTSRKDKKDEKKEKFSDNFSVYQIFGFTIYKENLITTNKPKHNNCCLLCESIRNCCDDIVCYANCNSIICRQIEKKEACSCCCCCCCPEYNEEDYTKNDFTFCYFYQGRRKQKWLHSFLVNKTQEELIPYMTQYFFLQLIVIGFDKTYNERESPDTWEENFDFFKLFIIVFCLFFYITITFSLFSFENIKNDIQEKKEKEKQDKEKEKPGENNEEKKEKLDGNIEKIDEENKIDKKETNQKEEKKDEKAPLLSIFQFTNELSGDTKSSIMSQNILNGTTGILLLNGLYCFILSAKYLAKQYEDDGLYEEEMKKDNFTFVPVLLNKFYYFTLIYFCLSYSEQKKGFELISGATLISLYITAFNFIFSLIIYVGAKTLITFQLVFSSIIALFWLLIIIIIIYSAIKEKSTNVIKYIFCLFFCRFFLLCFASFFLDENRQCCCCKEVIEKNKGEELKEKPINEGIKKNEEDKEILTIKEEKEN